MHKYVSSILRLSSINFLQKRNFAKNNKILLNPVKNILNLACNHFCTNALPEENYALTDEQLDSITKGNPELLEKLNILMLEVQVLRQDGDKVPNYSSIKLDQWEYLLSTRSRSARKKYLKYLWKNEKANENEKAKKEEMQKYREEYFKERDKEAIENEYRLFGNTIFLRLYDTTVNQFLNNRLVQAMQFGQPLVLDCSYTEHMTHRECLNTAKQLMLLFAANRAHDFPFDLHYCNVNRQDPTIKQLKKFIGTIDEPWFPLNIHEDSYLNHFPKERLVYLTPHCRNNLEEFNHDDVYIIGAMVDKTNTEPLSLAKAKQQGLRMARFPLDKYLAWSKSSKSLTLNQVCSILLDVRSTSDWAQSLKHVPTRKIMSDEELSQYKGKRRFERKSPFLIDQKSQNGFESFSEGFKNLDNYENFTNDLEMKKYKKINNRDFRNNSHNYNKDIVSQR
ncbi:mitochondrial ribonuclease P protein 1 homolog, partial [Ctenocephalides felis]|uniref:mitochondrial ribonuclease P protein 1 homolog n=1 Tax=Ctenocephalides felis TaxID=7515 RepID=UPI000E6E2BDC